MNDLIVVNNDDRENEIRLIPLYDNLTIREERRMTLRKMTM